MKRYTGEAASHEVDSFCSQDLQPGQVLQSAPLVTLPKGDILQLPYTKYFPPAHLVVVTCKAVVRIPIDALVCVSDARGFNEAALNDTFSHYLNAPLVLLSSRSLRLRQSPVRMKSGFGRSLANLA